MFIGQFAAVILDVFVGMASVFLLTLSLLSSVFLSPEKCICELAGGNGCCLVPKYPLT